MAATKKKARKGNSVQGGALFSDGVPCTDPDKEAAKAAKAVKAEKLATTVREERIDQIMSIMRQVATKSGAPTWNKPVGKALAKGWGVTYRYCLALAGEAGRRLRAEAMGTATTQEVQSLRDNLVNGMQRVFLHAIGTNDVKAIGTFAPIIHKITDGPTKVEVTVKTKEPTPMDAVSAVQEMFGAKVSYSGSETKSPDGTEPPGSPPEE